LDSININKPQKYHQIVHTALKLFSQKDYSATSVAQIAKAAGVGKGTVYYYFDTKADIFIAAVMKWLSKTEEQMSNKQEKIENPVQKLNAFIQTRMDLFDPQNLLHVRLFSEIIHQTFTAGGILKKRRYLVDDILARQCRTVMEIIFEGISSGDFRAEIAKDTPVIANNLLALMYGTGLQLIYSRGFFNAKKQIDSYMQQLYNLILV